MIVRSVRIVNYKCFDDSGDITFGERMNLVVGQNNAGKTALLDSFDHQRFTAKPHRDLTTDVHEILDPISKFEALISFSGTELYGILVGSGDSGIVIGLRTNDIEQAKAILEGLFDLKTIEYSLSFSSRTGWSKGGQDLPSPFSSLSDATQFQFLPSPDRTSWRVLAQNGTDNLPGLIA
jgi:AAA ATPase domain